MVYRRGGISNELDLGEQVSRSLMHDALASRLWVETERARFRLALEKQEAEKSPSSLKHMVIAVATTAVVAVVFGVRLVS